MLTPLNQQLSGNQPPPSMQPPPTTPGSTPPGTEPQSAMHPLAPSTLGELPQTPPQATRPSIGNPATPFADPTKNTPSLGIGQQLAAQGRGPDTALVHMAPRELQGLNALAQSSTGQNLPINPKTGLPEAGILSSLLPMLIGAVLTPLTGGIINPLTAGLLVGGGYGLATHSLTKGLMAGLSAYGGAGIGAAIGGLAGLGGAAAAGAGGAAVPMATETIGAAANPLALAGASAAPLAGSAAAPLVSGAVPSMASMLAGGAGSAASAATPLALQTAAGLAPSLATSAAPAAANLLSGAAPAIAPSSGGLAGLGSNFASALRAPGSAIPGTSMTAPGVPGMIPRGVTTALGATGVMSALGGAMEPGTPKSGSDPNAYNPASYAGPYKVVPRILNKPPANRDPNDSSEFNWFSSSQPDLPYSYTTQSGGAPPGYPGFVPLTKQQLDARKAAVGYAGGGSTDAPKAKKDFFANSLPLGLVGALAGGNIGGTSSLGGQGALAALGGLGGMGLMQALGYGGNPLAAFMRAPTQDIDPATGLPRRKIGVPTDASSAGMAKGGLVSLKPGGFVMDARTVSEVGNGSSNAGKEILRKHGGQPINSAEGDGVSDSIPARIAGGREARVARDEVHFPPEAVARIGAGNRRRGAKKLYGLMAQAHAARARAGRGADTGLRRGLA